MSKKQQTVLIGLSGGVDSSVAALLLKKKGYNVVGAFMKNYSETKNKFTGECAWREEKRMAEKIASILGIKFFVIDYEKEYKKEVIEPMFESYSKGLTPNPDILCNSLIKFPALWKEAQKIGADYIATGHYCRIKKGKKGFEMFMGKDKKKDQSYFLYQLSQKDLSHTIFPLGNLTKARVRDIAKKAKFPNWNKKGTRGICFIGKINMKNFLRKKIKEKKGEVISHQGIKVGTHPGQMYFTIGERVSDGKGFLFDKNFKKEIKTRWYVAKKLPKNKILIAPENSPLLKTKKVFIKNFSLINPKEKIKETLHARIRHLGKLEKGKLIKNKRWFFEFEKGIEGVAPGQFIVLYRREKVIGGGEIALK